MNMLLAQPVCTASIHYTYGCVCVCLNKLVLLLFAYLVLTGCAYSTIHACPCVLLLCDSLTWLLPALSG